MKALSVIVVIVLILRVLNTAKRVERSSVNVIWLILRVTVIIGYMWIIIARIASR